MSPSRKTGVVRVLHLPWHWLRGREESMFSVRRHGRNSREAAQEEIALAVYSCVSWSYHCRNPFMLRIEKRSYCFKQFVGHPTFHKRIGCLTTMGRHLLNLHNECLRVEFPNAVF